MFSYRFWNDVLTVLNSIVCRSCWQAYLQHWLGKLGAWRPWSPCRATRCLLLLLAPAEHHGSHWDTSPQELDERRVSEHTCTPNALCRHQSPHTYFGLAGFWNIAYPTFNTYPLPPRHIHITNLSGSGTWARLGEWPQPSWRSLPFLRQKEHSGHWGHRGCRTYTNTQVLLRSHED